MREQFISRLTRPRNEAAREEARLTSEDRAEILAKVVNLMTTEGIKYRAPYSPVAFFQIANSGFISSEAISETPREMVERWKSVAENPRKQSSSNVFYPEEALEFAKRVVNGYSPEDFAREGNIEDKDAIYAWKEKLRDFLTILKRIHEDGFALPPNVLNYYGSATDISADGFRQAFKDFLEENWPALIEAWHRKFFNELELSNGKDKDKQEHGWYAHEPGQLIQGIYGFDIAYALSPKIPTVPGARPFDSGSDYPTEAVLNTLRAAPRDIVGIVVNRYATSHSMFAETNYDLTDSDTSNADHIPWLKSTHFSLREGNKVFAFIAGHSREFGSDFEVYIENDAGLTDKEKARMRELLALPWAEQRTLSDELAERVSREYVRAIAPIAEGETLWSGITRVAEHLKVPIYDTEGKVIWPESQ